MIVHFIVHLFRARCQNRRKMLVVQSCHTSVVIYLGYSKFCSQFCNVVAAVW